MNYRSCCSCGADHDDSAEAQRSSFLSYGADSSARNSSAQARRVAGSSRRYRPLSGAALGRVVGYIEQNLAGDLRLSCLAEVAGMSRHGFGHAFKEATGTPPHRYVTERRIESAVALLAGSDVPIADVALRVGLSSQPSEHSFPRHGRGDAECLPPGPALRLNEACHRVLETSGVKLKDYRHVGSSRSDRI